MNDEDKSVDNNAQKKKIQISTTNQIFSYDIDIVHSLVLL
jgi:hypothetical protein